MTGGGALQTLLEQEREPIVFTQTYGYNLDYNAFTWTSIETNGFATCDIAFQWERGSGGTYTKTGSWDDFDTGDVTSYSDVTVWPADNGYLPTLRGQQVISQYYNGELTGSYTNTADAPTVEWMEKLAREGKPFEVPPKGWTGAEVICWG